MLLQQRDHVVQIGSFERDELIHVKKVEDVVKEGEELTVKVMEIDNQGRVNLSRKAVLIESKKEIKT